ncbi:MAG: cell envelope integrity EipB family protein [Hyphomicrobiaceae bacterium]|nr:cell envelope integrity EipB family protein [Hyphomicrobiaceae bacterium]
MTEPVRHGRAVTRASAAVTAFAFLAPAALAGAPQHAVQFAPHRAIYDITLARAATGSGVTEVEGRMVYELQGSRCEGYTQNMRFVTRMTSQDGSQQLNDLRTSSFEDVADKRLRFNSAQFRDQELVEQTSGDARPAHGASAIDVELTAPEARKLRLEGRPMFPMRHSEELVSEARAGRHHFVADLYDGSEKGEKVYMTSAVIGRGSTAAGAVLPARVVDRAKLAGVASWPVSVGYFEPQQAGKDAVPAYELSFRLFENGVSSGLVIDYGEFAVRGELADVTYFPASDCREGAGAGAVKRP